MTRTWFCNNKYFNGSTFTLLTVKPFINSSVHPFVLSSFQMLICFVLFWSVLICCDLFWSVLICVDFVDLCWSVLIFVDLCWSVLICVDLCWSVLICVDLCWSVNLSICSTVTCRNLCMRNTNNSLPYSSLYKTNNYW